jgi:dienelactone hydrolase
MLRTSARVSFLAVLFLATVFAQPPGNADSTTDRIRAFDTNVWPADSAQAKELRQTLVFDQRELRMGLNRSETKKWQAITTRAEWEKFRDARIAALRASLGSFPVPPREPTVVVTSTVKGNGYVIENLVYVSRPGLLVSANLYVPDKPTKSMPGLVIIHSHHNPKTQGELQDMGIIWARAGCCVLIPDMLGHGERRQHPFVDAKSYPPGFRIGREDYHFRYNLSMQLDLIGDSLMGWMANDLMRGVDVLLARPGVDKDRIILLGSVAGGGDPAGVTAALDPRIACVVPFNFGGPQPETRFPLPEDAEASFNYAGGGSWESTRNLRGSTAGGFMPWVICGSVAPRRLIHAHEFAWDRDRDPVWKRYEKIWSFYDAKDGLAFAHGRGALSGKPPEATHCNNIGAEHRKQIYAAFQKWYGIPAPERENTERHKPEELRCLTPEVVQKLGGKTVAELTSDIARRQLGTLERGWSTRPAPERDEIVKIMRAGWRKELHVLERPAEPLVRERLIGEIDGHAGERILLQVERDISVSLILFLPAKAKRPAAGSAIVLAVCQEGKARFVKEHAEAIAQLLDAGVAVCAVDVRGTGETAVGTDRGRTSSGTSFSSNEQMLGGTMLASRVRDLAAVQRYLRTRKEVNAARFGVWGDSFAPVNTAGDPFAVPWSAADKLPRQAEPLGGLLALLADVALSDVQAAYAHGGLASYRSALENPYLFVPHDATFPKGIPLGDVGGLARVFSGKGLWLEGLVDARNRRLSVKEAEAALGLPASDRLRYGVERSEDTAVAKWFVERLK